MIFLFLLFNFAFAEPLVIKSSLCACAESIQDPFEFPSHYNYGKNKSLCVDSCRFRPVKIIQNSTQDIEIANILHHAKFYRSKINLNLIKSAEIGFEEFTAGVRHVVLKFNFKENLILSEQTNSEKVSTRADSIIISAEGVPGKGRDYSLLEGFNGEYLVVTRVLTLSEYLRWTTSLKNPLIFYPLNLSGNQVEAAFNKAIKASEQNGLQEKYQLFTNNCSSKAYSFLGLKPFEKLELAQKIALALPIAGPISTYEFLRTEKLISLSDLVR